MDNLTSAIYISKTVRPSPAVRITHFLVLITASSLKRRWRSPVRQHFLKKLWFVDCRTKKTN